MGTPFGQYEYGNRDKFGRSDGRWHPATALTRDQPPDTLATNSGETASGTSDISRIPRVSNSAIQTLFHDFFT
jgi:hypothetical protein